jgi:hypothetical protein
MTLGGNRNRWHLVANYHIWKLTGLGQALPRIIAAVDDHGNELPVGVEGNLALKKAGSV